MVSDDKKIDTALQAWRRALEMTARVAADPTLTLPVLMDRLADRFTDAPALIGERETLTYRALAERSNRYARWALAQGIRPGDVVGLLMSNAPDYLAIWLGLTRTGAIVSLLNTHLVGESLAHVIKVVAAKHLISGTDFGDALGAVAPKLDRGMHYWAHGDGGHDAAARIDDVVGTYSGAPLESAECPLPSLRDRALFIYTSGTTGLPKAANVSHHRVMQWSHWFAGLANTGPDDRMYNCLPMYHSVGGIVAVGAALVTGGSVVIRRRFSAREFWDDVVDSDCTLFQYIGELCRYLVNAPPHPRERDHRLRLCCGNGLRPDVWEPFQRRFAIPKVLEFYAATEANFSLYNCEGKVGAIGRVPPFLAHRIRIVLVKVDPETGEPLRDEHGRCVRCEPDEPGEAISEITDRTAGARFEGYTDPAASQKKVLTDVFAVGDAWYRSGDLMRRDRAGFFYFVDRVGATFRWKGENVSTAEVAETLCACPGVKDAIVYGVAVPNADGRAGMAAIVTDAGFDLPSLRSHLEQRLPDYARPLFVRLLGEIVTTGTFKPKTQDYARAGYDPGIITDAIYLDDRAQRAYVRLDRGLFERVQKGELRL